MTDQPLNLDAIEAHANAATPGPWCTDGAEIYQGDEYLPGLSKWIGETCRADESDDGKADAAFIAAAREDVPALVAEVRRLRARVAELTKEPDADFFQPGHTYTSTVFRGRFTVDHIGIHPGSGKRYAHGWMHYEQGDSWAPEIVGDGLFDRFTDVTTPAPASA